MRLHRWEQATQRDGWRCWLCGAFVGRYRIAPYSWPKPIGPRRLPVELIEKLEDAAPECRIIRYLPLGHRAGEKGIDVLFAARTQPWDWLLPSPPIRWDEPVEPTARITFDREPVKSKLIYCRWRLSSLFLQRGDLRARGGEPLKLLRWEVMRAIADMVEVRERDRLGPIQWSELQIEVTREVWDWNLRTADYTVHHLPLNDPALERVIAELAQEAIRGTTQEAQVDAGPHVPPHRQGGEVRARR